MGFFSRKTKGVCPECNSVIEDVNDNFCSNCGWKISKIQAIKAKNGLKVDKDEAKPKPIRDNKIPIRFKVTTEVVNSRTEKEKSLSKEEKLILDRIRHNEEIARDLRYGNDEEKQEAIRLYEENISYNVCCYSYPNLASIYSSQREYDKAIDVLQKGIKVFSDNGEPTDLLEHSLKVALDSKTWDMISRSYRVSNDLITNGKIDEAIEVLNSTLELKPVFRTYTQLASLYHYKKEFEKERDMYILALEIAEHDNTLNVEQNLENVQRFLDTGKWKFDCLPSDPQTYAYEIKEAKTLLNSDEKEWGIVILEDLMEKGSYNNTVYYTLYQTYKKDKQFDDAIRVCEKAIEVLGLFSNDRKAKWTDYLDKVTKQKEKHQKKMSK